MSSIRGTLPGRIVRGVTHQHVEIFRRMFATYEEAGVEPALEGVHEDVVIEIPPEMSAEPDTYRGHDGARRYFAGFDGMLDDVRFEPIELVPVDDGVLAHLRVSGRGSSSGLDVRLDAFVVTEFADGKIIRMRAYPDRAAAERAIAGSEGR
jgi:ketosteroid isomerase-like protein